MSNNPSRTRTGIIVAAMSSITLASTLMGAPAGATEAAEQAPQVLVDDVLASEQQGEGAAVAQGDGEAEQPEPAGGESAGDTAPADPAEPEEPAGDPNAPASPDAPTDPSAPADPEAPADDPNAPVDADPSDPEVPSDPEAPATDPSAPAEPSDAGKADETPSTTDEVPGAAADGVAGSEIAEATPADETQTPEVQSSPSASASTASNGSMLVLSASGGDFDNAWGVSFCISGSQGTKWVGAQLVDGAWRVETPSSAYGSGTVSVTAWANVGSAPSKQLGSASTVIPSAAAKPSLSFDAASQKLVLTATGVSCPTGVSFVSVGVVSPSGTVRWYQLALQDDGTWTTTVDPSAFNWEAGTYALSAFICDANWNGVTGNSAQASVSFGSEAFSATLTSNGSRIALSASGGRFSQAWGVSFRVSGSNGTKWVAATRQADGSWAVDVPASTAGAGNATVDAWVNIGSTNAFSIASSSVSVGSAKATLGLAYDAASGKIVASATDVSCPTGVTFVSVGITSPAGIVHWYRLGQNADGSWSSAIDPTDFNWQSGTYTIAGSICDAAWGGADVGTGHASLSFGSENLVATTTTDGTQVTFAVNGGRYAQAWNVSFEVVSSSKTTWVAGTKQADGSWSVTSPSSDFGGGVLTVYSYACIGSKTSQVGSTTVRTYSETPEVTAVVRPSKDNILVTASGGAYAKASNVAFAVTNISEGSGASWYQAYKQPDGSWATEVPAAIDGVGTCTVEAFATYAGSTKSYASARYTYSVVPSTTTEIYLGGGDYSVSYGMAGLKVQRIQQALGIGDYNYPRYLSSTVSAVSTFQARVGLPATGVVDHATWLALGLSDGEWYTLGAYASPVQVEATASAAQRVEAMISRAYDYLGDPYVWDAAGAPSQGVDCAGLVMQALYAAGLDTGIINPVTHSTTAWGDHDAANFFNYGGFTKVSTSSIQRGDLVYYGGSAINHIAIYLGNNSIIEAYPGVVRTNSLWYSNILGVTRVFG